MGHSGDGVGRRQDPLSGAATGAFGRRKQTISMLLRQSFACVAQGSACAGERDAIRRFLHPNQQVGPNSWVSEALGQPTWAVPLVTTMALRKDTWRNVSWTPFGRSRSRSVDVFPAWLSGIGSVDRGGSGLGSENSAGPGAISPPGGGLREGLPPAPLLNTPLPRSRRAAPPRRKPGPAVGRVLVERRGLPLGRWSGRGGARPGSPPPGLHVAHMRSCFGLPKRN